MARIGLREPGGSTDDRVAVAHGDRTSVERGRAPDGTRQPADLRPVAVALLEEERSSQIRGG